MAKKMIFLGKELTLLTQKEKADELDISIRTFWDHLRKGRYDDQTIKLPDTTRLWYISTRQQSLSR